MAIPNPADAAVILFGRLPDLVSVLVERPEHAAYRVVLDGSVFVVKTDTDPMLVAREVDGHRRAARAGIPVADLVAAGEFCLATRFVDATPLSDVPSEVSWRAAGRALRDVHSVPGDDLPAHPLGIVSESWDEAVAVLVDRELRDCVRELGFDATRAALIRRAFSHAGSLIDGRAPAWCHGDCQPDHVLLRPGTREVVAIIDWADHRPGDPAWDLAVLTLDDPSLVDAVLDGYGATAPGDDLRPRIELYRVLRWLGEARWFAAHGYDATDPLERAATWSPP